MSAKSLLDFLQTDLSWYFVLTLYGSFTNSVEKIMIYSKSYFTRR